MAKVLEDLQSAWRWGRAPNLQAAMEMVMWALVVQKPDKVRLLYILDTDIVCVTRNCVFSGLHPTAMAHVEAGDSENWFVHQQREDFIGDWLTLTLIGDCFHLLSGAISYIPQPGMLKTGYYFIL